MICPRTSGRFFVRFMLESKGTSKYCGDRRNSPLMQETHKITTHTDAHALQFARYIYYIYIFTSQKKHLRTVETESCWVGDGGGEGGGFWDTNYVRNFLYSCFMICFKVLPQDWQCVTKTQTHGVLKCRNWLICVCVCSVHVCVADKSF